MATTRGKFGFNPNYLYHAEDWEALNDAYAGEKVVKEKSNGEKYLFFTAAQRLDGVGNTEAPGYKDYEAMKSRGSFPDYVTDACETLVGMLHTKAANIQLPKELEDMRERCTLAGESMLALLRRINELQLCPGRLGLLGDFDKDGKPVIVLYYAEDIENWTGDHDGECDYVALNESHMELDKASGMWKEEVEYRVIELVDGVYKSGTFENIETYTETELRSPIYRNTELRDKMPFSFVNSRDTLPLPDRAPLLGLARKCFTIYRGDVDYRLNLHLQGQDTLVVIDNIGGEDGTPTRVGAGAKVQVGIGGDAKYIGVNSQGLKEQRQCLDNDKKEARERAGHFIASGQPTQESGDALRTRLAAQTATLVSVAETGALALQTVLRTMAEWMGLNPAEVIISPNKEFFDIQLLGQDLELYMRAISEGAPLSLESLHILLEKRGVAQFTFEEEMKKIANNRTFLENFVKQPVTTPATTTQPVPPTVPQQP